MAVPCVCACVYACRCMCVCVYMCVHVCMYMYVVCMCVHMCMYVHVQCMCVWESFPMLQCKWCPWYLYVAPISSREHCYIHVAWEADAVP